MSFSSKRVLQAVMADLNQQDGLAVTANEAEFGLTYSPQPEDFFHRDGACTVRELAEEFDWTPEEMSRFAKAIVMGSAARGRDTLTADQCAKIRFDVLLYDMKTLCGELNAWGNTPLAQFGSRTPKAMLCSGDANDQQLLYELVQSLKYGNLG